MKEVFSSQVLLVATGVIVLLFILGSFGVIKSNISSLNSTNSTISGQLNTELDNATATPTP